MSEMWKRVVQRLKTGRKKCGDIVRYVDKWTNEHRAITLIFVLLFCLLVFLSVANSDAMRDSNPFWPFGFLDGYDRLKSKDLIQLLTLLLGLPVAFLVWHWRDVNKRADIKNTRKDTNLKEFQEVQLRAAGALDEKLPQEAREQLQIAALHQLRGFLRGDYGESFKRPAFELLLAGHAAAVHRIGVPEVQEKVSGKLIEQTLLAAEVLWKKLTPIDLTRMLIIRDEAAHIFTPNFPLDGRRFDFLNLSDKVLPENLDLNSSHFFSANLQNAHLNGAILKFAHFEGAYLFAAHLQGADLSWARIQGGNLSMAHLEGSDLSWVRLEGTNLTMAHLTGADLRVAQLESADLTLARLHGTHMQGARTDEKAIFTNAQFDKTTNFEFQHPTKDWPDLTEAEREEARAPWIARGMINVDALPPEPADG